MTEHPTHRPIHIPIEVRHQMRSATPSCSVAPRLRGTGAPAAPPNSSTNASRRCSARRFGCFLGCFLGCLTRAQHPYLEATVCQSAGRPHLVVLLARRNRVTRWMSQAQMCVALEALLLVTFLVPARKVTAGRGAPGGLSPGEITSPGGLSPSETTPTKKQKNKPSRSERAFQEDPNSF